MKGLKLELGKETWLSGPSLARGPAQPRPLPSARPPAHGPALAYPRPRIASGPACARPSSRTASTVRPSFAPAPALHSGTAQPQAERHDRAQHSHPAWLTGGPRLSSPTFPPPPPYFFPPTLPAMVTPPRPILTRQAWVGGHSDARNHPRTPKPWPREHRRPTRVQMTPRPSAASHDQWRLFKPNPEP
jgi:hypothetical protein